MADNPSYTNVTSSTTIDNTLPEIWTKQVEDVNWAKRFMAKFEVIKRELIEKEGDKLNIPKRQKLNISWDLTETTSLKGNEKKMQFDLVSYEPTEKGGAVAFTASARAKTLIELRKEAVYTLGEEAAEKKETDAFTALVSGCLAANILWGGDATGSGDIDATDKITPGTISKLKYKMEGAKVPKFDVGDPTNPRAKADGYYVCFLHPYQIYDLVTHTDYKTAAAQAGSTMSEQNAIGPAFRGFDAYWDGCLIYRSPLIVSAANGYSTTIYKGFMMGPRALGRAIGFFHENAIQFIWAEEKDDYGRYFGVALRWYDQVKVLNTDRLYALYTAATDLS